jgi:serine/threonine-protein kinase
MDTPDPSVPENPLPGDEQATVGGSPDGSAQDVADEENLQETFVPGDADTGTGDLADMAKSADEPQDSEPTAAISSADTGNTGDSGDSGSNRKSKASQLGDFKLLKKLGEGGMGEVYLARQEGLDRKVALKVLSKQLGKKQDFVDRFFREARAMAKLDHPNVVKVYAVEADKGRHYVAIEFIDGQSMQDWSDELERLTVPDAVRVTLQCAEALLHAHEMNLIHRDIKPDNVLVTKAGIVKVADFGLAKAADDDVSMTQSGTGLGTPLYMAPEQARDAKTVDLRADIYALGCSLYCYLTGELPFKGTTALELVMAKEKGLFTSARKLNSDIPDRLDLMIDRMIAKDPNHRYLNCSDLIKDLQSLNIASDALSFIEGASSASSGSSVASRPAANRKTATASATSGLSSLPAVSLPPPSSTRDAAKQRAQVANNAEWFVQHTNAKKRTVISRMTTEKVRQAIAGKLLDLKARAKQNENELFQPLAQFAEFEPAMKKRLSQARSDSRGGGLKDIYQKLDKQHQSRRRWRSLSFLFRSFMGWVWLTVALAVLILGSAGLWALVDSEASFEKLKSFLGLSG